MDIELTNDNMEYISFVARKYCDPIKTGCGDLATATAIYYFKQRVETIEDIKMHELYLSSNEMQDSIKNYNLDFYKFWLLILFLKDFTSSCFGATHVFDKVSVGENAEKIMKMLANAPFSADCEITISNGKESATINATWVEPLVLRTPIEKLKNIYPMVKVSKNNKQYHKIKFFMEKLDYFLFNYDNTYSLVNEGTKNWEFTAKILYLANLLDDYKYFSGYEDIVTVAGRTIRNKAYYIGKELKNHTKTISDTADYHKSPYCFIPDPE